MAYFGGMAYFGVYVLQIWGVGVVRRVRIHTKSFTRTLPRTWKEKFLGMPFQRADNLRKTTSPQTTPIPDFHGKPGVGPKSPGVPTEFLLSAKQSPTEFRRVPQIFPNFREFVGHPQTCVYPDVCLGIANVSGKAPFPGQGLWQIHNVPAPFALRNL